MDNLTLAAANAFILFFDAIHLLITSAQRKSKSLRFVSFGYLVLALAFLLVFIFHEAPAEILAMGFNLSFVLFFFLYFAGIRAFSGFKAWPAKYSCFLISGYALLVFVTILMPASFPRIAITSLLVAWIFADMIVTIWSVWQKRPLIEKILSMTALVGYPGYLLLRLAIIYRDSYADKFFTDSSLESTVSQLFMMINFSVMAAVAFLIDNRILLNELQSKNQQLEKQSITDQLTGLFNWHYLELWASHEAGHSRTGYPDQSGSHPISLVLLEIDAFSVIHDRFGSHQSDQVIRELANLIQTITHERDLVVRIDETKFLIILEDKNRHEALLLAENLRHQIESQPKPLICPYTASLGVAERETGENFEHWLERANAALDLARKSGSNRVVSAA